ncbi:hypothetical protein ILYODFUR_028874, partial [Ilyodon furcidens]
VFKVHSRGGEEPSSAKARMTTSRRESRPQNQAQNQAQAQHQGGPVGSSERNPAAEEEQQQSSQSLQRTSGSGPSPRVYSLTWVLVVSYFLAGIWIFLFFLQLFVSGI